jgi:hypothetical protein
MWWVLPECTKVTGNGSSWYACAVSAVACSRASLCMATWDVGCSCRWYVHAMRERSPLVHWSARSAESYSTSLFGSHWGFCVIYDAAFTSVAPHTHLYTRYRISCTVVPNSPSNIRDSQRSSCYTLLTPPPPLPDVIPFASQTIVIVTWVSCPWQTKLGRMQTKV